MVGNYPVITLCGSTRFKDAFMAAQKRLTLEGYIVISVGLFGHSGDDEVWENMPENTVTRTKAMLDDMHKRKIDMADEIYVLNVDDYIGQSTQSEIDYARTHGKIVRFLEPHVDAEEPAHARPGDVTSGALREGCDAYGNDADENDDDDYAALEAVMRQAVQGNQATSIYPPDEATSRLIAYQNGEDDGMMQESDATETADDEEARDLAWARENKDALRTYYYPMFQGENFTHEEKVDWLPRSFAMTESAARWLVDTWEREDAALLARQAGRAADGTEQVPTSYAVDVSENDEEQDVVAAKEMYALQMLRDGYDVGNTAYFIGEDEAFVRAVMARNGITDRDLMQFRRQ